MEQTTREPRSTELPLQVLAADDDALGARLLGMFLQRLGHTAVVVSCGEEVLEQLGSRHFDLALIDVEMPGKNGLSTLQDIRARGITVPVVAITGHAETEFRERCLAAGFAAYLCKPLRLQDLESAIRRVQQPALTCADAGVPASASSTALHGLAHELGLEPATLAVLLRAFLLSGTQDAEAMLAAMAAGDASQTRQRAHRLRGSLGTLAAHELAALVSSIEDQARSGTIEAGGGMAERFHTHFQAFCASARQWLLQQEASAS